MLAVRFFKLRIMQREIKFRGFQKSWIYGGITIFQNEATIFDINCVANSAYEVDINSVGQFTNLHDKKGNEIYEGDVLQTRSGIGYMVFDNCGYAIKSPGSEAVDYEFSAFYLECEIIGNIYENPELLQSS